MEHEKIMKVWDGWRKYIAEGGKASWPRDEFERLLDSLEEDKNMTNLHKFGEEMWEWLKDKEDLFEFDESEEILGIGQKYGLVENVEYDPLKHGEMDCDEGDMIWYWGDAKDDQVEVEIDVLSKGLLKLEGHLLKGDVDLFFSNGKWLLFEISGSDIMDGKTLEALIKQLGAGVK